MSYYCGKLCSLILSEHFGSIVQTVADYLFKSGPQPLAFIKISTGLDVSKVKEALCILIKYGFVTHEQGEKVINYTLHSDRVILVLHYSRFMFFVKTYCGDEGEKIFDEILKNGYETASDVIIRTYRRLERANQVASIVCLKEKFELLVENQFLMRCLSTSTIAEDPDDKPDYSLPNLSVAVLNKILAGGKDDPNDRNIYWKVNFDRLIQDLRDQVMVDAMTRIVDDNAGELMRQLLVLMYVRTASWANTSNPIPCTDIKDSVKKLNIPFLYQYVDQYLQLIREESCSFLQRVGDSGGGQYSVNMKEAFAQLAWTTIENIVMERFGSKAARIFRLVRSRSFIEQEQIQQLAMIPAKEAKHLTYTLLQENYLQMQEVKKAGVATVPSKAFFLFHIDLNEVVRMEVDHCYHALYNMMYRKDHECDVNRRMIDKQFRLQALTKNLEEHGAPEEQIAEIAEMMTPSEKVQMDKVQMTIKKLNAAELQTEETLFLLQMYLRYH